MSEYRQVFFFEVQPGHWVSVTMKGDFDNDIWLALDAFMKRHATRPAPAEVQRMIKEEVASWDNPPDSAGGNDAR